MKYQILILALALSGCSSVNGVPKKEFCIDEATDMVSDEPSTINYYGSYQAAYNAAYEQCLKTKY